MDRVGQIWRAKPGMARDYIERHQTIWPELAALLRDCGVHGYSIYIRGDLIFSHLEVDDYDALVQRFNASPVAQRWEREMSELIEYPNADSETGWAERMQEVWSL